MRKPYAGSADAEMVNYLSKIGGTKKKQLGTYSSESDGIDPDGLRDVEVPRYGPEELLQLSNRPDVFLVDARPFAGMTRYRWPVLVEIPWPISRATYDKIAARPWPAPEIGTLIASEYKQPEPEKLPPRKQAPKKSIGDFARSLREDDD